MINLLLSILGLINSTYLGFLSLTGAKFCGAGSLCKEVIQSSWGSLFGIPVSVFAAAYFLAMLVLAWRYVSGKQDLAALRWQFNLSLVALLISSVLTIVQLVVLPGFCLFCFLNFNLVLLLFIFVALQLRRENGLFPIINIEGLSKVAMILSVSLILPLLIFGAYKLGELNSSSESSLQIISAIDGNRVTLGELDARLGAEMKKLDLQRYNMRKQALERMVIESEAKKSGAGFNQILEEAVARYSTVTDEEIDDFYRDYKSQIPAGMTKAQARAQINAFLTNNKKQSAYQRFIDELFISKGIKNNIPRPGQVTVKRNPSGSYSIGNPNAPIRIVEFSDLQCPYCSKAHNAMKEILKSDLKDQIYFEFRHFPLSMHESAFDAAIAAHCAGKQDKFWEALDVFFSQQSKLKTTQPKAMLTAALTLDVAVLEACIKDPKSKSAIQIDQQIGIDIGINATPTFIINDRQESGIPTETSLRRLIQ